MKTLLHVGCGPKRKDRTTAEEFDAWVRPEQIALSCRP